MISGRKTGFVPDCRITKFSQCAVQENEGQSGFSYRFNLDVSLNSVQQDLTNIHFYSVFPL